MLVTINYANCFLPVPVAPNDALFVVTKPMRAIGLKRKGFTIATMSSSQNLIKAVE